MAITLGLVINLQFIQFIFYAATHSRFTLFFITFFFLLCMFYFSLLFYHFLPLLRAFLLCVFLFLFPFLFVLFLSFRDKFKLISFGDQFCLHNTHKQINKQIEPNRTEPETNLVENTQNLSYNLEKEFAILICNTQHTHRERGNNCFIEFLIVYKHLIGAVADSIQITFRILFYATAAAAAAQRFWHGQ